MQEITSTPIRILHLEDSPLDHDLVCRSLTGAAFNFVIDRIDTLDALLNRVRHSFVDVILADYRLPGFTAIDAWQSLQALTPTAIHTFIGCDWGVCRSRGNQAWNE